MAIRFECWRDNYYSTKLRTVSFRSFCSWSSAASVSSSFARLCALLAAIKCLYTSNSLPDLGARRKHVTVWSFVWNYAHFPASARTFRFALSTRLFRIHPVVESRVLLDTSGSVLQCDGFSAWLNTEYRARAPPSERCLSILARYLFALHSLNQRMQECDVGVVQRAVCFQ